MHPSLAMVATGQLDGKSPGNKVIQTSQLLPAFKFTNKITIVSSLSQFTAWVKVL